MLNTRKPSELLSGLNAIRIQGGGDCPEMALTGLSAALENALDNSVAYVFTDASAKDYALYDAIVQELQRKQIKVSFLLTGVCSDGKSAPGYTVYENLSRISGGQVFEIRRSKVKDVLTAIIGEIDPKFQLLEALYFDKAGSSKTHLNAAINLAKITVIVSGKNVNLTIINENGAKMGTSNKISLENLIIVSFEPKNETYEINASADSAYSLHVSGTTYESMFNV